MMGTAIDSSVIVAAVSSWHDRHVDSRRAVATLLAGDVPPVVPAHALVEAFSVLTRLPPGYRISPLDARRLLDGAFRRRARITAEPGRATWKLLTAAVDTGVAGGAVCDLRILRAARAAGASRLLTLNPGDFERIGDDRILIVEP